jgi:hypothetical protein
VILKVVKFLEEFDEIADVVERGDPRRAASRPSRYGAQ